jgi:hypothetical protein
MDRVSPEETSADDIMAEPLETNSLELRIAFHNAVSRIQEWTAIMRAAGERGRIVSEFASHVGLARLVEMQYVTKQPQSERKTLYVITRL